MGRLKGLRRVRQDGRLYVYHRATGTRMPDLPENHPEFLAAYLAAENGAPRQTRGRYRAGTMGALWLNVVRSDRYKALSPAYRAIMRRGAEKILDRGADVPVRQVRTSHITNDLGSLAPHPANERRKVWRLLMGHAVEIGLITDDPSAQVAKRSTPRAKQHPPWTATDIALFRARWAPGSAQRLAFELLYWTGARIGSAVTLGTGMVDRDGWLHYIQSKTDGPVWIPFRRDLPDFVDPADMQHLHTAIAAAPNTHMVWMTTQAGKPRSVKAASSWFAKAALAAGIEGGKSAHGLRVTRAIALAEGGATPHQIGAWTGHESLKEIAHYSKQASRKRLLSGTPPERKFVQDGNS
ncbi:MAG: tyrosine-type recombinase/integrase [Marinibacterium sp.]